MARNARFSLFLSSVLVSQCTISLTVCLDDIYLSGYLLRKAAHVNRMFSLLCPFVALIVSHFGFEGSQFLITAYLLPLLKSCSNGT